MKRANKTGTVYKLSGNRRRPYIARVTVGFDADGKQLVKTIGVYASKDDAVVALAEYLQKHYDIDMRKITFTGLYTKWLSRAEKQGRLSAQSLKRLRSVYKKHCYGLYDIPYSAIRANMMQECIDSAGGYAVQGAVKMLFHQLDNYAMEFDAIEKKYSDLVHTSSPSPKTKTVFSDAEVRRLWGCVDAPQVDIVLILLYSGWRAQELLDLRKEDIVIDGETPYMRGGAKTKAGKDRIVPIHSNILPLVRARYESCNTHLVEYNDRPVTYITFKWRFDCVMKAMDMNHNPHETRHTFRTWLNIAKAPLSCVNKIMGHSCKDVGLGVYTHDTIAQLGAAIESIGAFDTGGGRVAVNNG